MNAYQGGLIRDDYASEGASAAVKFGSSSVRYVGGMVTAVELAEHSSMQSAIQCSEDEFDLPFLKKWVRTKHTILFLISNITVQVVFYDRRFHSLALQ